MALLGIALRRGTKATWCRQSPTTAANTERLACISTSINTASQPPRAEAFEGVSTAYERLLHAGALQPDASQASAVRLLQLLQAAVLQREESRYFAAAAASSNPPPPPETSSSTGSSSGPLSSTTNTSTHPGPSDPAPATAGATAGARGAYLWGPVGSGKTALMDLFLGSTRTGLQQLAARQQPAPASAASTSSSSSASTAASSSSSSPSSGSPDSSGSSSSSAGCGDAGGRGVCRAHFHEFMQGVHGRLHALQLARPRVVGRSRQGMLVYRYAEPEEDPLVTVAREYGSRTAVLCLDELHVTDVADAMILARLFGSLLVDQSTAIVFTSNRPPLDLYKGGLSRKYFEPFVRLVDEQMVVAQVAAGVDFRRRTNTNTVSSTGNTGSNTATTGHQLSSSTNNAGGGDDSDGRLGGGNTGARQGSQQQLKPAVAASASGRTTASSSAVACGSWHVGPGAEQRLRSSWQEQQQQQQQRRTSEVVHSSSGDRQGAAGGGVEVPLAYGRTLKVPYASGDAAFFTFGQLCGAAGLRTGVDEGGALGAPDYLALCRRFRQLYVCGVPQLGPPQRDEARRLVTLLDVAYDNRCVLHAAGEVPTDELFAPLLEEARRQGINASLGLPKASRAQPAKRQGPPAVPTTTATAPASSATPTTTITTATAPAAATSSGSSQGPLQQQHEQRQPSQQAQSPQFPQSPQQSQAPQHVGHAAPLPGELAVPRAVLAEEVLMYHRAASRLAEMCQLVAAGRGTAMKKPQNALIASRRALADPEPEPGPGPAGPVP